MNAYSPPVKCGDPFETLARQIDETEEEPGFEDDLLPLSHPAMQQAIAHYFEVVRAKDALRGRAMSRAFALRLPPISEQDADTAFLHLSRLRDRLVHANENTAACRVDEAIEKLEDACRELSGKREN